MAMGGRAVHLQRGDALSRANRAPSLLGTRVNYEPRGKSGKLQYRALGELQSRIYDVRIGERDCGCGRLGLQLRGTVHANEHQGGGRKGDKVLGWVGDGE